VAEAIEQLAADSSGMMTRLQQALARRGTGHWLERMMSPAQLETFRRTQALMSLLEGYSNHVMNAAGERLLPGFRQIHDRFERRNEGRTAIERAIMRITGLDLKMEQYRKGEQFVRAIAAHRGAAALSRLWEGPETLPRDGEIEAPERWMARVLDGAAT